MENNLESVGGLVLGIENDIKGTFCICSKVREGIGWIKIHGYYLGYLVGMGVTVMGLPMVLVGLVTGGVLLFVELKVSPG